MHRTDAEYFDRIEATEYAVMHDDGRHPEDMGEADVVLIGVSRTSKTPLCMYLAYKGIRAANLPLAPGMEPPSQLFEVDPRRMFGLITSVEVLIDIRQDGAQNYRGFQQGDWIGQGFQPRVNNITGFAFGAPRPVP